MKRDPMLILRGFEGPQLVVIEGRLVDLWAKFTGSDYSWLAASDLSLITWMILRTVINFHFLFSLKKVIAVKASSWIEDSQPVQRRVSSSSTYYLFSRFSSELYIAVNNRKKFILYLFFICCNCSSFYSFFWNVYLLVIYFIFLLDSDL